MLQNNDASGSTRVNKETVAWSHENLEIDFKNQKKLIW